jgi:hypothetical protein
MTRSHHRIHLSIVRRLRHSPTSFAAAAAVYDPWLLLQTVASRTRAR